MCGYWLFSFFHEGVDPPHFLIDFDFVIWVFGELIDYAVCIVFDPFYDCAEVGLPVSLFFVCIAAGYVGWEFSVVAAIGFA